MILESESEVALLCLTLCDPMDGSLPGSRVHGIFHARLLQVKKKQLELDMEQQICSKSGKEYIKAVCCHPAYLTYMQSTSW